MSAMTFAAPLPAPESARGGPDALAALFARISRRDERALETLFDLSSRRVFALTLHILGERGAAEEATLDVFVQVWDQADRYDPLRGTPLGWLLTLARTRAIDLRRSRSRWVEREAALDDDLILADPRPTPESASDDEREASRVRRAIASLPADQREALRIVYYGGLSHAEAARALGRPLGTVKTRVRQGLSHLGRLLSTQGDSLS